MGTISGKRIVIGTLTVLLLVGLGIGPGSAADPIVGQWNYQTSNHWSEGPVPAGKPSQGVLVIEPDGDGFKMEFQSGMVFNPPELKYFNGSKTPQGYEFANSAKVDNEGGVAKNGCTLTSTGSDQFAGKSTSQYSNGAVTFRWGFDIVLMR